MSNYLFDGCLIKDDEAGPMFNPLTNVYHLLISPFCCHSVQYWCFYTKCSKREMLIL